MSDDQKPEQSHVLLKQDEITQALVNQILRNQGIDPAAHETSSNVVYRIVDSKLLASVVIERVVPHTQPKP